MNRRCNSALSNALRPAPPKKIVVGGWVVVYNTAAATRQGANTDTGANVLKAKLSLNRTGPYKVLAAGPCSSANTPDGPPLGSWICLPICPTLMLAGAYRYNAASSVPTATTVATCRSIVLSELTQ